MDLREPLTQGVLADIWSSFSGELSAIDALKNPDFNLAPILAIDAPERASPHSLCFVGKGTPARIIASLKPALCISEPSVTGFSSTLPVLRVPQVRPLLAHFLTTLHHQWNRSSPFIQGNGNTIHPTATVEGVLEGGVVVGPHAYIASGAFVGRNSLIGAGASVAAHCHLGRNCELQPYGCIGERGFGFFEGGDSLTSMPHPAGVRLGDRVFIGAHATVMAGVLHPTEIGDDCKLDAHCHIGHNACIGKRSLLAAYACLAGSASAGDDLRMGGYAALSGKVVVGNRVSIAAKAGVLKNFGDDSVLAGYPARPIHQWRRNLGKRSSTEASPRDLE
jgi:UDP-3-O-[3-hydroxymyristoyl] glucosamine N-acyltransferase LpxD